MRYLDNLQCKKAYVDVSEVLSWFCFMLCKQKQGSLGF